jgi:hypothetical protein
MAGMMDSLEAPKVEIEPPIDNAGQKILLDYWLANGVRVHFPRAVILIQWNCHRECYRISPSFPWNVPGMRMTVSPTGWSEPTLFGISARM